MKLGNEMQVTRSIFRYGYKAELMDRPARFGVGFDKPSAKALRQQRTAGGPKMFTAEQIRSILDEAGRL